MGSRLSPWDFGFEHIDYERVIKEFGLKPLNNELISKMKNPHRLFVRRLLFAHRDFDQILEAGEAGREFVVMTGMMPSGKFHLGHKLVAELLVWFQMQGVKLYIAISDIEAHVVRGLTIRQTREIAIKEYILNYVALGMDLINTNKCVIYSQWKNDYVKNLAFTASSKITLSQMKDMYGFTSSDNMGKIFFPFIQIGDILHPQLPKFGGIKHVLVPVGLDQDLHIRLARDVAPKLGMIKPSSIYLKMMSGLQGPSTKMSSSMPETAIFLSEDPEKAKEKIVNAFSGGRPTAQEQKAKGGQPGICAPFMLLLFHFNDDILKRISIECTNGTILCGECKEIIAEEISRFLREHQKKMKKAKDILSQIVKIQPV